MDGDQNPKATESTLGTGTKSADVSSISGPHTVEGENRFLQVVL